MRYRSITALLFLPISPVAAQDLAKLSRAYRSDPTAANQAAVLQYASTHRDASGALAFLALGANEIEQKQYSLGLRHLEDSGHRLPSLID